MDVCEAINASWNLPLFVRAADGEIRFTETFVTIFKPCFSTCEHPFFEFTLKMDGNVTCKTGDAGNTAHTGYAANSERRMSADIRSEQDGTHTTITVYVTY